MNAPLNDLSSNPTGSDSASGGGGSTSSGGGTSSSVVDAMMIEQVLKNPNASQKDIARILDYIKDHPDIVDNKTVSALKERQTSTLGGGDNTPDENDPSRPQPKPEQEVAQARPIERQVTSEDIIAAAKDKASFESFSRGGNAFENADAAQAAGNGLALKTSGELREMAGGGNAVSQLDSALAASGINFGSLRGLLSGQVESSRAENYAPSNQQGVEVAATTGVAPPR